MTPSQRLVLGRAAVIIDLRGGERRRLAAGSRVYGGQWLRLPLPGCDVFQGNCGAGWERDAGSGPERRHPHLEVIVRAEP